MSIGLVRIPNVPNIRVVEREGGIGFDKSYYSPAQPVSRGSSPAKNR